MNISSIIESMVDVIGLVTDKNWASPLSLSVLAKVRCLLEYVILVATGEMYFNFISGMKHFFVGVKSY